MTKKAWIYTAAVVGVAVVLIVIFPPVTRFVEAVAMDIRRFWWLVLIVLLGIWSAWVLKSRNRE